MTCGNGISHSRATCVSSSCSGGSQYILCPHCIGVRCACACHSSSTDFNAMIGTRVYDFFFLLSSNPSIWIHMLSIEICLNLFFVWTRSIDSHLQIGREHTLFQHECGARTAFQLWNRQRNSLCRLAYNRSLPCIQCVLWNAAQPQSRIHTAKRSAVRMKTKSDLITWIYTTNKYVYLFMHAWVIC